MSQRTNTNTNTKPRTESGRTESGRTESGRTESGRTESGRTESEWAMTPAGADLLKRGVAELDLDDADIESQLSQFSDLLHLLQEGNRKINLTALKTEQDIILKHFVDSLSCLRGGYLDATSDTTLSLSVADIGTGAGFPSLPLAMLRPQAHFTPIDSVGKKVEFVRATAESLGLSNVAAVVGRAETLGQQPSYRAQFDRVVVRAVAALPILVELALPLLKVGGVLVAQKGPIAEDELQAGRMAAREVGGMIREIDSFSLPLQGDARTLIIVEKTAATPVKYPRREGVPNQLPLFWNSK